jgi:ribonuclease HII
MATTFRIGVDENGLGSRLGPLVVTAVLARTDAKGRETLARRLPRSIRASLDDSKRLVSHTNVRLGEAWARELVAADVPSPAALFERLSLEGGPKLRERCPAHAEAQCWSGVSEDFSAEPALRRGVTRHRALLAARGVELVTVKASVLCTETLNRARRAGRNRFVSDLHAMETLVLALRREAAADVTAVCGKVGSMAEYSRFFGPLGGWLHNVLDEGPARSAYRFPGVGEIAFVRDADASDPLVMLASLVGKYVRELFMARIAAHYPSAAAEARPSGYHDAVTSAFVDRTALVRKRRKMPDHCFERERDLAERASERPRTSGGGRAGRS